MWQKRANVVLIMFEGKEADDKMLPGTQLTGKVVVKHYFPISLEFSCHILKRGCQRTLIQVLC